MQDSWVEGNLEVAGQLLISRQQMTAAKKLFLLWEKFYIQSPEVSVRMFCDMEENREALFSNRVFPYEKKELSVLKYIKQYNNSARSTDI